MRLRKGDVVRKKRGGGTKRAEVMNVTKGHALLRMLATSATQRRCAVATLTLPLDERGMPEGYEVVR